LSEREEPKRRYHRRKTPLDAKGLPAMVGAFLAGRLGVAVEEISFDFEVLNDAVARCRYRVDGGGWRMESGVIAKRFRSEAMARYAFRVQSELWSRGFNRAAGDLIAVPESLALVDDFVLMEDVGGSKGTAVVKREKDERVAVLAARALHKLHTSGLAARASPDHGRTLPRPGHEPTGLPREWSLRLAALARSVEAAAIEHEPANLVPLHRDFHLGQMLVRGEHAWLLDTALAVMGDPAQDVANLLVSAYARERPLPNLPSLLSAFKATYFGLAGDEAVARVPIFEAMALHRRATKRLVAGDSAAAERLLALTEERLAAAG
jgi:hypothetical protein